MKSQNESILKLALLCTSIIFIFSAAELGTQGASAQKIITGKQDEVKSTEQQLTIAVTVFGINQQTGNVLTFIDFNNLVKASYYNASSTDLKDKGAKDGIVQVYLQLPIKKLIPGSEFSACTLVLRDQQLVCQKGHISPYQSTSFTDLVINNTK